VADGRTLLTWVTGAEIDNVGFNLYRARTIDGERSKVNNDLILASGEVAGSTYTYEDTNAGDGEYYYWLEDIDTSGRTTLHGPQSAQASSTSPGTSLFLPVIWN
jgi:hypothetical protein